jgi:hypothetical protein
MMSGNIGELFETMKVRLKMQEDGLSNPSDSVKLATRTLVQKLAKIDPLETFEVSFSGQALAKYIRSSTGEVLAEINDA